MRVPPRVGSSSGIGVKSGLRRTCGTRGLNRLLKPLMKPSTSTRRWLARSDRAVDGGVQSGSVAARRQDADAFHATLAFLGCATRR